MEKPDQISYLAELQNLSIGEVQEDVGDYGTRRQWEQGDPNALWTLPCAHGSSLLKKDAGGFGLLQCREHGVSAVFFNKRRVGFEARNVPVKTYRDNPVLQSLFPSEPLFKMELWKTGMFNWIYLELPGLNMCWYEMNGEFHVSSSWTSVCPLGTSVTEPWPHKLIPWLADFVVGLRPRVGGEVDAPRCLGPLSWAADLKSPALKVYKSRKWLPGMPQKHSALPWRWGDFNQKYAVSKNWRNFHYCFLWCAYSADKGR